MTKGFTFNSEITELLLDYFERKGKDPDMSKVIIQQLNQPFFMSIKSQLIEDCLDFYRKEFNIVTVFKQETVDGITREKPILIY